MRFEVPQFIEIEDKIFGPFTWRQFLYLGGGVGLAVTMFFTLPLIIFILLGIPIAALAGALAFYPINNRPFSFFLEAIYNYTTKQRLYLWKQKSEMIYKSAVPKTANDITVVMPGKEAPKKKGGITSLARRLELEALQKPE